MIKKIILLLFILFSFSVDAYAASIFLDSPKDINTDQVFEAKIKLDATGETVNSFAISLAYAEDLLTFVGYKENSTIIKIFIDKPEASLGQVSFSGIVPGGVSGFYDPNKKDIATIPVITLLFEPKDNGEGVFSFKNIQILKHDGLGTNLNTQSSDQNIKIDFSKENTENKKEDTTKPLPFEINLIEASEASNTPLMLYFNTRDLDSGIKNYQLKLNNGSWINVESPYVVSKGFFEKDFTIRAFDYAGNYEDSSLRLEGKSPFSLIVLIIVLVVFGLWLYYLLILRNGKSKKF